MSNTTLRTLGRTLLLATLATGCLAQGSAGFGAGAGLSSGPRSAPPSSQISDEEPGTTSYAGPAGISGEPGPAATAPQGAAEPRWDDFAFAVRERSATFWQPWVIQKFTTFKVGAACWQKLPQKDSGALNNTAWYAGQVQELAKKWTGEDWEDVETQHSDRNRDRVHVEPMMDEFAKRFHLTIAVEGEDCETDRDAFWVRYWYTVGNAFSKYPPSAGKLFVTLNVVQAARDIKVEVDDTGTVFTITAPRDLETKDWTDKIEKPFRKATRNL